MTLENVLEAILFAADKPLQATSLEVLLEESEWSVRAAEIREALGRLTEKYRNQPVTLAEVAGGFRFQVAVEYAPYVGLLHEEKPQKYSRALLETLAIIAYRQPITRGDIEDIRGVAVSSNIMKTLQERQWVRSVGHKDVPGRPALFATTKQFLDYFNLKSLDQLPALADVRDLDEIGRSLELQVGEPPVSAEEALPSTEEPQTPDQTEDLLDSGENDNTLH